MQLWQDVRRILNQRWKLHGNRITAMKCTESLHSVKTCKYVERRRSVSGRCIFNGRRMRRSMWNGYHQRFLKWCLGVPMGPPWQRDHCDTTNSGRRIRSVGRTPRHAFLKLLLEGGCLLKYLLSYSGSIEFPFARSQ